MYALIMAGGTILATVGGVATTEEAITVVVMGATTKME